MTTTIDGTNGIGLPSTGSLKFNGASSTSVSLVASPTGTTSLTLPSATGNLIAASGSGTAGQVLTSTGSGLPVWAPAAGGGLFGSLLSTTPTQASTGLTTVLNQGSATISNTAAGITIANASAPSTQVGLITSSTPSTPYTLTILGAITSDGNYGGAMAIGWRDASSGKLEFLMMSYGANNSGTYVVQQQSSFSNYYANVEVSYYGMYPKYPTWMQIADDGINIRYSYSTDGINFTNIFSGTKAGSYLGGTGYNQLMWFSSTGGMIGGNQGGIFTASPGYGTLMSWKIT